MRSPHTLLFLLCASLLMAQFPPTATEIKGVFDRFTTDELGNVYALRGDELLLFDAQGKRLARNSVKTFGNISCIDAFSSMKPMIFSRDQSLIAVLDNTLSVQGDAIDLARNGFPQVTLACMSVQNSFWLFDERQLQFMRLDAQLHTISNTGRLDQLLGFTPHPSSMVEEDGWLYVCDPEQGVLVFDLFGGYAKALPVIGAGAVEVRAGAVLYLKDGVLHRYDLKSFNVDLPITWLVGKDIPRALDVRIENGSLYALFPDRIVIGTAEPQKK